MDAKKRRICRNIAIYFALIVVIMFAVWISLLQYRTPEVVSIDADSSEFSAERAMEYLQEITKEPHPVGSEAHAEVREYLISALTSFGLSPEVQEAWVSNTSSWGYFYEGPVKNVVARIPGEDSSAAIMLTAHYDSVEGSPGAADDGSGVAAMLETIRILTNSDSLKNDVIILFSDAEEIGTIGAQVFADQHPWAKEIGVVLNFEARGNEGPAVLFETSDGNDRMITVYSEVVPNAIANSLYFEVYKHLVNNTDLSVYKAAGMHGYNLGFIQGGQSYHSSSDSADNLSMTSLQHMGDSMLSLVKSLGYMDLVDQDEGNRVYFNLIGNKVVSYLEKWVKPLMITSVFFFIATLVHGYIRKKITVLGTLGGLLLFLLTGGASYLMGQYFYSYLMNAYADQAWILAESNSTSLALFIGSIVFIFGFVALIYRLASKIFKPYNLTIGAFIVWQVLVIYSSYYYVGASYLFIWPFLMGLIGVNLNFILSWKHWKLNFLVKLAVQIPILLITAPIIYLIYNFWFLEATPIQSVLIVLMSAFMIPILCTSRKTAKKTTVPKNDENEGSPHLILNMNSN